MLIHANLETKKYLLQKQFNFWLYKKFTTDYNHGFLEQIHSSKIQYIIPRTLYAASVIITKWNKISWLSIKISPLQIITVSQFNNPVNYTEVLDIPLQCHKLQYTHKYHLFNKVFYPVFLYPVSLSNNLGSYQVPALMTCAQFTAPNLVLPYKQKITPLPLLHTSPSKLPHRVINWPITTSVMMQRNWW